MQDEMIPLIKYELHILTQEEKHIQSAIIIT